jgi:hypothetical protein
MPEKQFICSNYISASTDGYEASGEEFWVIEQAVDHLMHEHGNEDSPELREEVKASLVDVPPNG